MDPTQLAQENDILRELIHINEILLDLCLEKRKKAHTPHEVITWNIENKDLPDSLLNRKEHLLQLV